MGRWYAAPPSTGASPKGSRASYAELVRRTAKAPPPTKRRAYFLFISGSVRTAKRRARYAAPGLIRRTAARWPGCFGPDFTQQNAPPFSGAFINLWMYRIRLIGATVFDTIWTLFFIRPGDGGFNFLQPLKRRCRQARIGGLKLRQPRAKRHGLRR